MLASECPDVPGDHYHMDWCAFETALFAAAREATAAAAAAAKEEVAAARVAAAEAAAKELEAHAQPLKAKRLQEKQDMFDNLIAPENRTNQAIPLHLLMTEHPDAHELGVPEEQQARLREYFAWCVSFSKAFAKGCMLCRCGSLTVAFFTYRQQNPDRMQVLQVKQLANTGTTNRRGFRVQVVRPVCRRAARQFASGSSIS